MEGTQLDEWTRAAPMTTFPETSLSTDPSHATDQGPVPRGIMNSISTNSLERDATAERAGKLE